MDNAENKGKVSLTKKTVSLAKKEKISLTKAVSNGLNKVFIGLGWDPVGSEPKNENKEEKKGFFSKLIKKAPTPASRPSGADIDCDAWVAVFDKGDNLIKTVYYGDKDYYNGGKTYVHHCGDNLTGEGEGDDEVIEVYLENLHSDAYRIRVGVTIYQATSRHQNFDMIQNLFVRVVDARDDFEICRFDNNDTAKDPGSLTFIVGDIVREPNGWEFKAIGEGNKATSISNAVRDYGR